MVDVASVAYEVIKDLQDQQVDDAFKLIIIGDAGVGKSYLLSRVMDSSFKEDQVTIGVEFGTFIIKVEGKIVKVQIWDTAGQESFRSVTRVFYRGANIVFLCYDITRRQTFDHLTTWLQEIKEAAAPDCIVYLIGSKVDLQDQREVSTEEADSFAKAQKINSFFETSAVSGHNVELVFSYAAKQMFFARKDIPRTPKTGTFVNALNQNKPKGQKLDTQGSVKKKDGCC